LVKSIAHVPLDDDAGQHIHTRWLAWSRFCEAGRSLCAFVMKYIFHFLPLALFLVLAHNFYYFFSVWWSSWQST
jgi:hypothetical protein